MKHYKHNCLFLALLLTLTVNNTAMEPTLSKIRRWYHENPWVNTIAHVLIGIGDIYALWQPINYQLPQEIKNEIFNLVIAGTTGRTLQEAAQAINALSQVNTELNTLINNPEYSFNLIKHLVKRFKSSEEDACNALSTKVAKEYLAANLPLKDILLNISKDITPTLSWLYDDIDEIKKISKSPYFDINFRFNNLGIREVDKPGTRCFIPEIFGGGNALMFAYLSGRHSRFLALQSFLSDFKLNINLSNKEGKTALMVAVDTAPFSVAGIDAVRNFLWNHSSVATTIDQQDFHGNTALLIALQTRKKTPARCLKPSDHYTKRYTAPISMITLDSNPQLPVIQLLLQYGADPELANFERLTPLQAAQQTSNQEIIDLIQDAINKKHGI